MSASNLVELLSQTKKYENHRRKVNSIMTKSSHSLSFRKDDVFNNFYSSRQKSNRYLLKLKQDAMQKQNDLILKKIIDVNKKTSSSAHLSIKNTSHNNLTNLRKNLQKTNEENQKLANKLVFTSSKLNQNILGQEYRKQAEVRERLRKYTVDQDSGQVLPKKIISLEKLRRVDVFMKNSIYQQSSRQNNSRVEE